MTGLLLQLRRALDKGYVIGGQSADDVKDLQANLGIVRSLLSVQVGQDEEDILKGSIWLVIIPILLCSSSNLTHFFPTRPSSPGLNPHRQNKPSVAA